jgi:hypothetical protein
MRAELVEYNIYRPTITDTTERDFWRQVHTYIKECEYPIQVNPVFDYIEHVLDLNERYDGGGLSYCFWFVNIEDKETFKTFFIRLVLDYKWYVPSTILEIEPPIAKYDINDHNNGRFREEYESKLYYYKLMSTEVKQ